tara:strand:+ start:5430 stop:8426 length:2997 start_codon:yes stop_codon:yes gene_type:complete
MASATVEAFRIYQSLKNKNAPQEVLDKALSIVQQINAEQGGFGDEDIMSREGRQARSEKNVEQLESAVAKADSIIDGLVSKGAPTEVISKAQEIRRKIADPLDVTEELYASGATALEGVSAGILGDEFRAKTISAITGVDYETQLAEERRIEREFFEDHPVLGYSILVGTSLIPSSMALKAVGVGKTALGGIGRGAAIAGTEGAIYGFAEGEGGVESRMESAVKSGLISAGIGGAFGGIAGRAEGRAIASREAMELAEAEEKRARMYLQGRLTEEVDGKTYTLQPQADEVISAFQVKMNENALQFFNETGRGLDGLDYGRALGEIAKDLGVPISRLRSAEAVTGKSVINFQDLTEKELRERIGTLADEVGFVNGKYQPGKLAAWYRDKISSAQILGEKYVGRRFGSAIQRTASLMARRHATTENIVSGSNVREFTASIADDLEARRLMLNMSNIDIANPAANIEIRKQAYEDLARHIQTNYGDNAVAGLEAMRARLRATSIEKSKKMDSRVIDDPYYWPSQMRGRTGDGFRTSAANKKTNTSAYEQKRDQIMRDDPVLGEYMDPMEIALGWLRQSDSELALIDTLKLKNLNVRRAELQANVAAGKANAAKKLRTFERRIQRGDALFDLVKSATRLEGADAGTAQKAQDLARSIVVMGSRGPSGLIANARKAAYMGTIGNPYSAILNVGDVFNSMVNYGTGNTVDAMIDMMRNRGLKISVDDVGLAQQTTGEFLRDGVGTIQARFNDLVEQSFKISGFRDIDRFGKNVALRAGLKEGQQLARSGKLESTWGHAFTENEMQSLKKDLLQGNKTNLTTEFAAAQLAKLQPSDMAQLPKWYLDNPNWRVLYMLRTFAIKQLEQMERLVVEEWRRGNKKEAYKNGIAYTMMVGGGNAAINEGRQILKGDEPSLEGYGMRFADHLLSAASLNTLGTYQVMRASQGDTGALVKSVAPAPASMVFAPVVDLFQFSIGSAEMDEFLEKSDSVGWLPFGRLVQSWVED